MPPVEAAVKAVAKPVALLLAFDALRDARLPRIASGVQNHHQLGPPLTSPLRPRRTMPTTTTECLGRTPCGLLVLLVLLVLLPGGAAGPYPTALPVADTTAINHCCSRYTGTIPTEARAGITATLSADERTIFVEMGRASTLNAWLPCR